MAWTNATLAAELRAAYAEDCPMLLTNNVATQVAGVGQWSATVHAGGPQYGDPDTVDPDFPVTNAYNGSLCLGSRSNSTATDQAFILYLDDVEFDALWLKFARLSLTSGTVNITVTIADSADFLTRPLDLAAWNAMSTSQTGRKANWIMYDVSGLAERFTGVRYLRVRIEALATLAAPPELGQLWLANRRQLPNKCMYPVDTKAIKSEVARFQAANRNIQNVVRWRGARDIQGSMLIGSADGRRFSNTFDTEAIMRAAYVDTQNGTTPLIYVEDPGSQPAQSRCMLFDDPSCVMLEQGYENWTTDLALLELPPFLERDPT